MGVQDLATSINWPFYIGERMNKIKYVVSCQGVIHNQARERIISNLKKIFGDCSEIVCFDDGAQITQLQEHLTKREQIALKVFDKIYDGLSCDLYCENLTHEEEVIIKSSMRNKVKWCFEIANEFIKQGEAK